MTVCGEDILSFTLKGGLPELRIMFAIDWLVVDTLYTGSQQSFLYSKFSKL